MTNTVLATVPSVLAADSDANHIRVGGSFRLPPVKSVDAAVADNGRIRLGGSFRLLTA